MKTTILVVLLIVIALLKICDVFNIPIFKKNSKEKYDLTRYYKMNSILTPVEKWMYNIIKETVNDEYIIAPKVGMKDFIGVKSGKDYMKHFGHIAQKHIDFLICTKDTLSPVLGIEIDDSSHNKPDRQKRDQEVDQIYNTIGLKIIHIPTKINEEALRNAIKNQIENLAPDI